MIKMNEGLVTEILSSKDLHLYWTEHYLVFKDIGGLLIQSL